MGTLQISLFIEIEPLSLAQELKKLDLTFHIEPCIDTKNILKRFDTRLESKVRIGSEGANLHMTERQTFYKTQREQSLHMSWSLTYSRNGILVESRDTIGFFLKKLSIKREPAWCREILKEAEKLSAPKGTFKESRNQISTPTL